MTVEIVYLAQRLHAISERGDRLIAATAAVLAFGPRNAPTGAAPRVAHQLSRGRERALEGSEVLIGGLAPLHLGDRRRE